MLRAGTTLKKAEPNDRPAPASDSRGDLLSQIRSGKSLRKVDESEKNVADSSPSGGGGAGLDG